jgi:hypothetical protein
MDFETFCASRGLSRSDLCNAGLHTRGHISDAAHARAMRQMLEEAATWQKKRDALRQEYSDLIERGELRPETRTERLIRKAQGHPDLASTQAARRLLERRGIPFHSS